MARLVGTFTFECNSLVEYNLLWADVTLDVLRGADINGNTLTNARHHGPPTSNRFRVDYTNDDFIPSQM